MSMIHTRPNLFRMRMLQCLAAPRKGLCMSCRLFNRRSKRGPRSLPKQKSVHYKDCPITMEVIEEFLEESGVAE